ncbi:MAG: hypothetical protein A3F74_27990 [Betaproteobacteria bacterium RIFCSPLOWO2_12_FULL_62_58]|nr:MAG: hypothetical protein A3F74_27990 [Betaproteobacteria bacterium RIFCSPLOWO2_12_FULL_62_58]
MTTFTPCNPFFRFSYSAADMFPSPTRPTVFGFLRVMTATALSASQASSQQTFGNAGVLIRSLTPLKAHSGGVAGGAGAGAPCAMIVISSSSGNTAVMW